MVWSREATQLLVLCHRFATAFDRFSATFICKLNDFAIKVAARLVGKVATFYFVSNNI